MSAEPLVLERIDAGVAVLSYNRPAKHNARNDAMTGQWEAALDRALADEAVRVIVLRGEGRSFSSGRDVGELGQRPDGASDEEFIARAQARQLKILHSAKPVLAALKGYVLGGALETALSCDLRVADPTARLAFPEIRHGLVTDTGGIPLTTRLAGPSRAKFLAMTAESIDADQALRWGLVDFVVEPEALDERVLELARTMAGFDPEALAAAKSIADTSVTEDLAEALRAELVAQAGLFAARRRAGL
ncbi:enoyl-CoA hydratase/isomerase family protein [Nocardia abscessus]|uniref:enoyl-CoA hydratase/isomerase family protein n=1 Tax=Nocardia TaxID=1817 RepID=UPI0018963BC1|nr:enoyl-CoA hydratase/isomerase family protein [Nocardia abscessus]MBF6207416.1 enoyl-CoA hydratase/isomerase family protein [Streptomyces gardneri]MBF6472453.1 enoyl-CoA hydratase/isomerase family protein [Nocardia abscessus]